MSKVALVTGGTRGIGRGVCEALQAADYTVAANYAGNDAATREFTEETGIPPTNSTWVITRPARTALPPWSRTSEMWAS